MISVASSKHEALLRELGVDEFVDYTKTQVEDIFRDIDLVVDCVGGPDTGRFLRTRKRGGALFPIFPLGFTGAHEVETMGVTVSSTQVRSNGAQLGQLASLLDDGTIRVVIDSTYPLPDASKSHGRAALGNLQGKLVLMME